MHYAYILSVRETLARLRWMLDDVGSHPDLAVLDLTRLIERHLRLLLMGEQYADMSVRATLSKYLPPEAVTPIEETLHDCLLFDVQQFMSLEEDCSVVEVTCKWDGDLYLVVEEREVVRRMVDDFNSQEFGRYQIEDECIAKMFCD